MYIIIGKYKEHYGLNILSGAFHFELTTVFLQPPPLSRVFLWNRLLLLVARGNPAVVETMDESECVSGHQRTDLIVEQAQSIFYILQHSTLILPVSREGEVLLRLLLVLDDGREQEALYYYSEIQVVYIAII